MEKLELCFDIIEAFKTSTNSVKTSLLFDFSTDELKHIQETICKRVADDIYDDFCKHYYEHYFNS